MRTGDPKQGRGKEPPRVRTPENIPEWGAAPAWARRGHVLQEGKRTSVAGAGNVGQRRDREGWRTKQGPVTQAASSVVQAEQARAKGTGRGIGRGDGQRA